MAAEKTPTSAYVRPSRVGLKTLIVYVEQDVADHLKYLAVHEHTTSQELLREAIQDLFAKRGKVFEVHDAPKPKATKPQRTARA